MTSARDLTAHLADLLRRERAALGEFLVALADFDGRRLWRDVGYASLFDFLHRELGLSKASASFRKKAAELIQRFPDVAEPLRDGRLCLTSVFELAKVLTPENRSEVLPRFFQLGKREAKAVAAALRPDDAPPRRGVVTSVRIPALPPTLSASGAVGPEVRPEKSDSLRVVCPAKPPRASSAPERQPETAPVSPPSPPPTKAEPLTAELNRLHVTVSSRFLEKLEAARAALSHSHPGASAQEILEAGLDLLIERHAKRRGKVERPRREPPPSKPEHVPAHVKRAVWERDGGRCQWKLDGGGICGSTHQVEFDHAVARGRGGPPTVENLRLLCRVHNQLAARHVYGDEWMDRFTRKGSAPTCSGSQTYLQPALERSWHACDASRGFTMPLALNRPSAAPRSGPPRPSLTRARSARSRDNAR